MRIPGIERDDEGTIVIEISPTMRLVALAGAMILAGVIIWWVALKKEEARQVRISRVPGDIPLASDFVETPDVLMPPEQTVGVSPHSLLNIERVANADREELEEIFGEILSQGLPDLTSEEAQLYNGLISRSAEIAPNRSLRFYDMLEGGNQRSYSISQLYKKWIDLNPVEALETAKLVEEPLRFHTLARDLPNLAKQRPAAAFEAALLTRNDYFEHVEPDFVRPVTRTWGKDAFGAAEEAALALTPDSGRHEALQGLALAKLDTVSDWSEAYAWASELENSQDRLWTQLTLAELGIHRGEVGAAEAAEDFSNLTLKQHLLRLVEAQRMAMAYSSGQRYEKTWQLVRSTDPYDTHGRQCVLNALENPSEREHEAIYLRMRWPNVAEGTFLADQYLLTSAIPASVPQKPLVNLLVRGEEALENEDLDSANRDFLTYLHYNPRLTDADPYLTRWSKEAGVWLGDGATMLDEVTVPANAFEEGSKLFDVMDVLAKQYAAKTDSKIEFFIFEAISGITPVDIAAWGSYGEVTIREALDILTENSGIVVHHKDYGIVGYYWRDEDIALEMGSPIELIPYHIE